MSGDTLTTAAAPEPRGPYPHARISGDLVHVTGQIGRDPATGEFVPGGFGPEFHRAISNLEAILAGTGARLEDVLHATVQFVDEGDLDEMNAIYRERFREPYPARTSYGVAFLWKGARVQIDAVARLAPGAGR
jgi:2-iminobutanoate/2-iminopropanoate deaminase